MKLLLMQILEYLQSIFLQHQCNVEKKTLELIQNTFFMDIEEKKTFSVSEGALLNTLIFFLA